MQATKQSQALLKQDKEYLNRQLQDLSSRCSLAEEKLEQTTIQLNEAKQAREAIYEKYISVRYKGLIISIIYYKSFFL